MSDELLKRITELENDVHWRVNQMGDQACNDDGPGVKYHAEEAKKSLDELARLLVENIGL